LANGNAGEELPATYFISAVDASGRDIHLTILPESAAQDKAKRDSSRYGYQAGTGIGSSAQFWLTLGVSSHFVGF
jgi:hypothetical protein